LKEINIPLVSKDQVKEIMDQFVEDSSVDYKEIVQTVIESLKPLVNDLPPFAVIYPPDGMGFGPLDNGGSINYTGRVGMEWFSVVPTLKPDDTFTLVYISSNDATVFSTYCRFLSMEQNGWYANGWSDTYSNFQDNQWRIPRYVLKYKLKGSRTPKRLEARKIITLRKGWVNEII
jgi:hypothetical protein